MGSRLESGHSAPCFFSNAGAQSLGNEATNSNLFSRFCLGLWSIIPPSSKQKKRSSVQANEGSLRCINAVELHAPRKATKLVCSHVKILVSAQ